MISNLRPYPVMKGSGAEWLGVVPVHWEVRRLVNVLKERGESNAMGRIREVLSFTRDRGVVPYAEKGNAGNKAPEDITRHKIVRQLNVCEAATPITDEPETSEILDDSDHSLDVDDPNSEEARTLMDELEP